MKTTNTDREWQRWNRAFAGNEYYYGDDAGPVARRAMRYAKPHLPPRARALDAGCGEGQDLAFLAAQGLIATGLEFTPEGARKTRQLLQQRNLHAEVIEGDLRNLDASLRFDLVLAVNSVQFLGSDAPHVIDALMQVTNAGSVIGLSLFACETGENVKDTIYRVSLENLLERFRDWQPLEAAKLWQWTSSGEAQPFVTLVARKPLEVRITP